MDRQQLLDTAYRYYVAERHLLPMYAHLVASALFPIYAGAHASLSRPSSAAKPTKKKRSPAQSGDEDDEDEEGVQEMQGMSAREAALYPVFAGVTLAGLYWLIKTYGAKAINLIFGWYFAFAGVFSVAKLVGDAVTLGVGFVFPTYCGTLGGKLFRLDDSSRTAVVQGGSNNGSVGGSFASPFSLYLRPKALNNNLWAVRATLKQRYTLNIRDSSSTTKTNFTLIHVLATALGISASLYANLVSKPWYLTNLQGFAVCYTAFQMLSPTSFTTGSLLLAGLFCYDIWAVFFTPLMVTVAKNLDQPIKLVFPRPEEIIDPQRIPFVPHRMSEVTGKKPQQYSMLGLGDIVLPGIMI
ncbi:hypothetical protein LTR53_018158, partial [Teratosphaeriaceae sp. CCFEE 6253]